jgi:hypothetical protein
MDFILFFEYYNDNVFLSFAIGINEKLHCCMVIKHFFKFYKIKKKKKTFKLLLYQTID